MYRIARVRVWKRARTTPPALVYTLGGTAANAEYHFKVAASGFYQYFVRLSIFFPHLSKRAGIFFFFVLVNLQCAEGHGTGKALKNSKRKKENWPN